MSSSDFRNKKNKLFSEANKTLDAWDKGCKEATRVRDVVENTGVILKDLDRQFCEKTGLTLTDVSFLFLAVGLQVARQYLLSNDKCRVPHNKGDELMDEFLSLSHPNLCDVLTLSVPYDAVNIGNFNLGNTGLSGSTHRYRTLGHDPILGWIFGTANIMTNSLTKYDLETYQVKNMKIIRHYPNGVGGMMERCVKYAKDDPKLLMVSVARQAIHFGSDVFTTQGLPVPLISTMDNQLAQKMLTKWHIDMWSIARGASLATFVNQLIAVIHNLFYDGSSDMDRRLYEVRTRKILSYSNFIASSSNVAVVMLTEDMTKLDVGGIGVAIYRMITDAKFIRKVKEDFIYGSYEKMLMGDAVL